MTTTITTTSPPITAAVRAVAVSKTYGRGPTAVRALDGVSCEVPPGSFTAIMGPSGSGKSTLMHCLAGLDPVDEGTVQLGGTDLRRLSEKERTLLRRDHVGFVFQGFNLVPALTAEENITLPLDLAGRRADAGWVAQLVSTLGLQDRLGHTPGELSGGQQQRVAIARALVNRPAVVFADEPTGNLDSTAGTQVLRFLRSAARDLGQTIVMVTHDASAASYADRVIFIADGRIVDELADPTAAAVLDRMKDIDVAAATEEVQP